MRGWPRRRGSSIRCTALLSSSPYHAVPGGAGTDLDVRRRPIPDPARGAGPTCRNMRREACGTNDADCEGPLACRPPCPPCPNASMPCSAHSPACLRSAPFTRTAVASTGTAATTTARTAVITATVRLRLRPSHHWRRAPRHCRPALPRHRPRITCSATAAKPVRPAPRQCTGAIPATARISIATTTAWAASRPAIARQV